MTTRRGCKSREQSLAGQGDHFNHQFSWCRYSDFPHQARPKHHQLSPVLLDTLCLGCSITLLLQLMFPFQMSLVTSICIFCYIFLRSENYDFARRELNRSAVQTPAQSRAKTKGINRTPITPHRCGCYFYCTWAYPSNILGNF